MRQLFQVLMSLAGMVEIPHQRDIGFLKLSFQERDLD